VILVGVRAEFLHVIIHCSQPGSTTLWSLFLGNKISECTVLWSCSGQAGHERTLLGLPCRHNSCMYQLIG